MRRTPPPSRRPRRTSRPSARTSTERIALRVTWDSAAAARGIHANDGRTYANDDQERWLREQFHRRDPEGYRTLLLADLQVGGTMLTVRSAQDLAARFPGQHHAELHRLLQRDESEVVAGARARPPWISRYEVNDLEQRLAALEQSAP